MGSKKPLYAGMDWAFTETAKKMIFDMESLGFDYDLAVSMINAAIEKGNLKEEDMYQIPPDFVSEEVK